jgi:hypothetical protein
MERIAKKVRAQEVDPLKEEVETLAERNKRLERGALEGAWSRAIHEVDVDTEGGTDELVELWLEKHTTYDEEHGPVALDDQGQPDFVMLDGGGHRPKTPTDLLKELKKSGKYPSWFRGSTRPGAGYNDSGKGSAPEKSAKDMSEAEKRAWRAEHTVEEWQEKLARDYGRIK